MEINPIAAEIAATVAEVRVANIEETSDWYSGRKYDYTLFGDVLEHLRDPEHVLRCCRQCLQDGGHVITSIPNLMHYSVIRNLLNGDFTYTDTGLLNRTHIHFFTFNEIKRMFSRAGFVLDEVNKSSIQQEFEDSQYIEKLMSISERAERHMFQTIEYIVVASISEN